LLEQIRYALGSLCALAQPMVDAGNIDAQTSLTARGNRVEESKAIVNAFF